MGRTLEKVTEEQLELMQKDPKLFWQNVTEIGERAFEGRTSLKEITIPESVEWIANDAFANTDCVLHIKDGNKTYKVPASMLETTSLEEIKEQGRLGLLGAAALATQKAKDSTTTHEVPSDEKNASTKENKPTIFE